MSAAQYSTAAACDQIDHLATLDDIRIVKARIDEREQQLRTENKSVEKALQNRPEKKPEETKSALEVIEERPEKQQSALQEQALAADLFRVESETAAVTVSELSGACHKVKNRRLR